MILPYIDSRTVENKDKLKNFLENSKFILEQTINSIERQLSYFTQHLYLKTYSQTGATVSAGANNTYGSSSAVSPDSDYYCIIPLVASVNVTGTFGTGETVTVKVTLTFDDGTTQDLALKSATAVTTLVWQTHEIANGFNNALNVVKVSASASSNLTATSVSIALTVKGFQLR